MGNNFAFISKVFLLTSSTLNMFMCINCNISNSYRLILYIHTYIHMCMCLKCGNQYNQIADGI